MSVLICLLLLLPVQAPAQSTKKPSLVELAQREKERREAMKTEVKLITNADLAKFSAAKVSVATRAPRPASVSEDTEQEASAEQQVTRVDRESGKPDLAFWQTAFSEATLNLKNAVNTKLVLQLRINNLRNAFFAEEDGSTRDLIQRQLSETIAGLEQVESQIDQAQKALDSLRKEARRAGLPAGVIRDLVGDVPDAGTFMESTNPVP